MISTAPGRVELLSLVFDPVFQVADRSYLPIGTRSYLDKNLPRFRHGNYDIASRLLLCIASAFVYNNLPKSAYGSITRDKAASKGLFKMLDAFPDGRKFLKSLPAKK